MLNQQFHDDTNRINVRALPSDFDRWNETNWTSDIMIPYFDKMELYDTSNGDLPFWRHMSTSPPEESVQRGHNGPISVQLAGSAKMVVDPVAKAFISSALTAGIPLASNGFNDKDEEKRKGVGLYEFNIRNGLRDSVASALLSDDRIEYSIPKNLVVWTGCTVHRVVFDESPKPKVIGVVYDVGNTNHLYKVLLEHDSQRSRSPEVLLAAGAVLTPQILSNSGVSDGGEISNLKNVGRNLQDHPVVAVSYEESLSLENEVSHIVDVNATKKMDYLDALKYWKAPVSLQDSSNDESVKSKNFGVMGTASFSAGAFLASPWSKNGIPDIQLTVFPKVEEPHYYHAFESKKFSQSKRNMLVTIALLRPEGRRTIRLAPYDEWVGFTLPTIYPGGNSKYLTDTDVKRIKWGITQVREIMSQYPIAKNTTMEVFPGPKVKDAKLRDFIISESMTNSHWCGSTRMGENASDSVVDDQLRVHGVDRLRIVDAGVMPFIPNGNTHSTTCAVALRAVDIVLGH